MTLFQICGELLKVDLCLQFFQRRGGFRAACRFDEDGDHRSLSLRLHDRDSDKLKVLHYTADYPLEYRLSRNPPPILAGLSDYRPEAVRENLEPVSHHRPVSHWFAFAALACVWGGILLRRL